MVWMWCVIYRFIDLFKSMHIDQSLSPYRHCHCHNYQNNTTHHRTLGSEVFKALSHHGSCRFTWQTKMYYSVDTRAIWTGFTELRYLATNNTRPADQEVRGQCFYLHRQSLAITVFTSTPLLNLSFHLNLLKIPLYMLEPNMSDDLES